MIHLLIMPYYCLTCFPSYSDISLTKQNTITYFRTLSSILGTTLNVRGFSSAQLLVGEMNLGKITLLPLCSFFTTAYIMSATNLISLIDNHTVLCLSVWLAVVVDGLMG